MLGYNALGVSSRTEGVPISGVHYDRASSLVVGGEASLRAGAGGVAIGRFGWASVDGVVLNERTDAQDLIGLAVIQFGDWRRVFWDEATHTWRIREGLNVTMLSGAPGIWVSMKGGASWNQRVYADPVDGRPVAGYGAGLESTHWAVGTPIGPGGLSLLTTWNTPNA